MTSDEFGRSVSMSVDDVTVVVGTPWNDDHGHMSGHTRIFAYSSTANKWNQL